MTTQYIMDVPIDCDGVRYQLRHASYDQALALFDFVKSQRKALGELEIELMKTIRGEMS